MPKLQLIFKKNLGQHWVHVAGLQFRIKSVAAVATKQTHDCIGTSFNEIIKLILNSMNILGMLAFTTIEIFSNHLPNLEAILAYVGY